MRRRLLNLMTALSLLLCAAVVVMWLWLPSDTAYDFHTSSRRYTVRTTQRQVWLDVAEGQWANGQFGAPPGKFYRLAAQNRHRLPGGFEYVKHPATDPKEAWWLWLFIPYWSLLATTGLLPAFWMIRAAWRRNRARVDPGSKPCPVCGYDLRATPGRCPECGHTVRTATAA
jgi:hypothetical protein